MFPRFHRFFKLILSLIINAKVRLRGRGLEASGKGPQQVESINDERNLFGYEW